MTNKPRISVCICTYKRPELLGRLLSKLENQETENLFDISVIVVDNDNRQSARETVETFVRRSNFSVQYHVEPRQNIALARNMTVKHATGDFVAFIDDDEIPIDQWLKRMYVTLLNYDVDGILGPVRPLFEIDPPSWMVKAGLFERPNSQNYETGFRLDWTMTGTGNVLVKRSILSEVTGPFKEEFGSGGEDFDFFRRAMALSKVFIWCEQATVYEIVPVDRTRLSFHLRRALLRGKASLSSPAGDAVGIGKSVVACITYIMVLPIFLMMGRHVFARYMVSACDHMGKLLAACRVEVIKEKYILK